MANDLNQCNFIGRLGADPEVRFLPSGEPVANLRLAVGRQWRDKQTGNKQESTTWLTLVAFGKTAEIVQRFMGKGSRIYAGCEARVRKWQGQDGQDRYATEFVIRQMQMLDSRDSRDDQGQQSGGYGGQQQRRPPPQSQPPGYGAPPPNQAPQGGGGGFDDFNDEIPFARFPNIAGG